MNVVDIVQGVRDLIADQGHLVKGRTSNALRPHSGYCLEYAFQVVEGRVSEGLSKEAELAMVEVRKRVPEKHRDQDLWRFNDAQYTTYQQVMDALDETLVALISNELEYEQLDGLAENVYS